MFPTGTFVKFVFICLLEIQDGHHQRIKQTKNQKDICIKYNILVCKLIYIQDGYHHREKKIKKTFVLDTIYCNVLNVCKLIYIPYANFGVYVY